MSNIEAQYESKSIHKIKDKKFESIPNKSYMLKVAIVNRATH